jgi:hypothetical protein
VPAGLHRTRLVSAREEYLRRRADLPRTWPHPVEDEPEPFLEVGEPAGPAGSDKPTALRQATVMPGQRDSTGSLVTPERYTGADRTDLVSYLRGAPELAHGMGFERDPYDPSGLIPLSLRTDGEWVWPDALAYYLDRHGFAPEADLVMHIRHRAYRLPELSEDDLIRLARLHRRMSTGTA